MDYLPVHYYHSVNVTSAFLHSQIARIPRRDGTSCAHCAGNLSKGAYGCQTCPNPFVLVRLISLIDPFPVTSPLCFRVFTLGILQCIECADRYGREAHSSRYGFRHRLILEAETRKCYLCGTSEGDSWNVCLQCSQKGDKYIIVSQLCLLRPRVFNSLLELAFLTLLKVYGLCEEPWED
jgi:hypothetical protein